MCYFRNERVNLKNEINLKKSIQGNLICLVVETFLKLPPDPILICKYCDEYLANKLSTWLF